MNTSNLGVQKVQIKLQNDEGKLLPEIINISKKK